MQTAININSIKPLPLNIKSSVEVAERRNEFDKLFFEFPEFIERKEQILREIDDYGEEKIRCFMDSASDLDYKSELLTDELEQMKRRFGYEHADMLERILINQVLFSWLKLKLFEIRQIDQDDKKNNLSFVLQLRRAQGQFRNAYETLLKVKKLLPEFECL